MFIRLFRSLMFAPLLFAPVIPVLSVASHAQIGVSITIGPPPLPVYAQPLCPGDGYIWVPGYWAYDYDVDDYYWVPGTWVLPPEVGFLWTPGYWGWFGNRFVFHEGYWGPVVGFYGGINYGFGYFGDGYFGGRWEHGRFFYNRAVNNVNVTVIHNVYNTRINNITRSRVSFNGGNGGINARPTAEQERAAHERHIAPVAAQTHQVQAARGNRELRASVNRGKPPVAATARPGEFSDRGVMRARKAGGAYHPPATRPAGEHRENTPVSSSENRPSRPAGSARHAGDIPRAERPAARSTGNPRLDQKYQRQQEQLSAKHDRERQSLGRKQEQEHQRLAQQKANDSRRQQVEQRHQQQTERMQQRQEQQQQKLQSRQQPRERANQSKPQKEKNPH